VLRQANDVTTLSRFFADVSVLSSATEVTAVGQVSTSVSVDEDGGKEDTFDPVDESVLLARATVAYDRQRFDELYKIIESKK